MPKMPTFFKKRELYLSDDEIARLRMEEDRAIAESLRRNAGPEISQRRLSGSSYPRDPFFSLFGNEIEDSAGEIGQAFLAEYDLDNGANLETLLNAFVRRLTSRSWSKPTATKYLLDLLEKHRRERGL